MITNHTQKSLLVNNHFDPAQTFLFFNLKELISKFTIDLLDHTEHAAESFEDLVSEKVLEVLENMSEAGQNLELPTFYAFLLNFGLFEYYWRTFGFNFEMKDSD